MDNGSSADKGRDRPKQATLLWAVLLWEWGDQGLQDGQWWQGDPSFIVSRQKIHKTSFLYFHRQVVEGKHTVYRMSASTEEEKDDWIKCIQWVAVARLVKLLPLNPITYISCHFSLVLSFCMERQLTGRAR